MREALTVALLEHLAGLSSRPITWAAQSTPKGRTWMALQGRPKADFDWPTPDTINRKSRKAMTASSNNGRRSGGGNSSPPGLEQVALLSCGVLPKEMEGIALPPKTADMVSRLLSGGCSADEGHRLNPDWVAQLQGVPEGWLDV